MMNPSRAIQIPGRHSIDLILAVLVFSFFMPVVSQDFLYLDDHGVFSKSLAGELDPVDNYYLRDGRPLTGMALVTAVNFSDTFSGFRLLRTISLLTMVCLAVCLKRLLSGVGIQRLPAAIIALAVVTTPAMAVYVGWGTCFLYPASAFASLLSGQLVRRMVIEKPGVVRGLLLGCLAIILVMMALSIYQITATFFIIPLMLELSKYVGERSLNSAAALKAILRQTASFAIVAGFGLVLYLMTVTLLKARFLSEEMRFGQRSNFRIPEIENWLAHAKALVSMVVPSWYHFSGILVQAVIVFLCIGAVGYACIGIWLRQKEHPASKQWIVWMLIHGSAIAPILMLVFVDQPTTPWRLYSGTSSVLFIWLTILLYKSHQKGIFEKGRSFIGMLFLAVITGNVALGSYVFRAGFVSPNVEETRLAGKLWELNNPDECSLLVLVAPKWYELETPGTFEYGFRASGLTGLFPKHAFRSFYANTYGRAALEEGPEFMVLDAQLPVEIPSEVCVYTLQDLAGDRYRVDPMEITPPVWHKTFGPVVQLHEGVLYSEIFGYFFETAWNWYFNSALGRVMVVPENNRLEDLDPGTADEIQQDKDQNTDWIWSENLDKWIQLRELKEFRTIQ